MDFFLDNAHYSVWVIDRKYKVLYVNNAFRIGFRHAFGVDINVGDVIVGKLPEKFLYLWMERYSKALAGESFTIDEFFSDKKDLPRYIQVSLSPIVTNKKITGVTCVGRDLTRDKINEIALRNADVLLKSSLESQKDTILLSVDKEFRYLYFNTANFDVMRYSYGVEVAIGMNILDCITNNEDRIAALENYTRALNGESHSNIRAYGEINKEYYESFFNPIRDADNNIIGATAMARNITNRVKQEEALRIANATKDKFLSIISHDLRSPISSISILSNLIYDTFDDYTIDELKRYLKIICAGLDSTNILLEDLLMWAKTQNKKIDFKPEILNLSDITNQIIDIFNQNIIIKELSILKNYPQNFELFADKQMISTILRNLLSNAIKFSNVKGNIEIGFSRMAEDGADKVFVSVNDSGIGISKKNISNLFNLGEFISTKGTQDEKGSGLGLIMCKEFVEKHNGEIIIESEINKGTCVRIMLPQ